MSREIKFRGKGIDTGDWVFGTLTYIDDKPAIIYGSIEFIDGFELRGSNWDWVDPDTIGQYTGVKDRNGKEVFEGDLLRTFEGDIMLVKWVGSGFVTSSSRSRVPGLVNSNRYAYPVSSIIGNIHDNMELLEGEGL